MRSGLANQLWTATTAGCSRHASPYKAKQSRPYYPVDMCGVSLTRFARMLRWCRRNVKQDDWDHQLHAEPMFGNMVGTVRFYFANAADAVQFETTWHSRGGITPVRIFPR